MPQDAYTLRLYSKELDKMLTGGKISRINQPEKEELSLLIYAGGKTSKLTFNVNAAECGVYFTCDERENPLVAPNFCMLLRKHLQNAEILSVRLVGFERILAFRLLCTSDFSSCERILYAEVMGKYSNVILTENGTVLGAMKTTSFDEHTKRLICAGAKYVLPEKQDKASPLDKTELNAYLSDPPAERKELGRYLFLRVSGLAPCTGDRIAEEYRGSDLADHVRSFILREETSPCVCGRGVDFYAYAVKGGVAFPSLREAMTYFYAKKRSKKQFDAYKRKLEAAVRSAKKKQEKLLAIIVDKKRECDDIELNRIKGELITANLYALQRGMEGCKLYNYYDEAGGSLKIALDKNLSPSQNAQKYYKRYQKQKRTLEALVPQEESALKELDYSESLLSALSVAESEEDLRSLEEELTANGLIKAEQGKGKKRREESSFRLFEKDGFTVCSGRNNLQNDKLVRSSAPDDVWLHTQKYHSSHVVIKTQGRVVPESVLLFAASVCARFSDGKAGTKIPVDYCPVKYVKKPSGSKAGFAVYTDYKTLLVDPLATDD